MAVYHAIRRLALPQGVDWLKVRCPIACSSVVIENASLNAVLIRSEQNPDCYKRLPSGAEYTIRSPVVTWDPQDPSEICEVQAPSADAILVVSFTR